MVPGMAEQQHVLMTGQKGLKVFKELEQLLVCSSQRLQVLVLVGTADNLPQCGAHLAAQLNERQHPFRGSSMFS